MNFFIEVLDWHNWKRGVSKWKKKKKSMYPIQEKIKSWYTGIVTVLEPIGECDCGCFWKCFYRAEMYQNDIYLFIY
jgi:hypothetical protein